MTSILIDDFDYILPESKIPDRPLPQRDKSKLLVYKKGNMETSIFEELPHHLPDNYLLVFNDTKVFPARLIFQKDSGTFIEVFCLSPLPSKQEKNVMLWQCMVGNAKRWKDEILALESGSYKINATLISREEDLFNVKFEFEGSENFYEIVENLALLPLPPYMNRKADQSDKERYQTVYAKHEGSVAAPTAGLHFTDEVLAKINNRAYLTLHVGAGTFKPVKEKEVSKHVMHSENFTISTELLQKLAANECIIPVGTTSMRVLESLYHLGCKWLEHDFCSEIKQWDGMENTKSHSYQNVFHYMSQHLEANNQSTLSGSSQIFILPGYKFRVCKGIITNFHQPKSTLILLVAALVGDDWRRIYDFALQNDFRFLSYGDSSLLLP